MEHREVERYDLVRGKQSDQELYGVEWLAEDLAAT